MSKSNYPTKIDASTELPIVRDNISELSSEIINAYRSAILQIEQTLGVNPHGSAGQTVASRLNRVLDEMGNLKKDAITQANLLSGPVRNEDIAKDAGISESKLNLNVGTTLLQNEVGSLSSRLKTLTSTLDEINAVLSAHVNENSINRHKAKAISVDAFDVTPSSEAISDFDSMSLQDTIEDIYNRHIGFDGTNVSETNASHSAKQIFFDNSEISDLIPNTNVQDAVIDLAKIESAGLVKTVLNISSNGLVRNGKTYDAFSSTSKNMKIFEESNASYEFASGISRTLFTFTAKIDDDETLQEFDEIDMSGSEFGDDNVTYHISNIIRDEDSLIESIEVFGGPKNRVDSAIQLTGYKKPYVDFGLNALNSSVRPRSLRTNIGDIVVMNPSAPVIFSSTVLFHLITSTKNSFDVSYDGKDAVTISTFDSNISEQTIDSMVFKMNEQFVASHLPLMACKIYIGRDYVFAVSHLLPNMADDKVRRKIKITAGAEKDGTDILGLSGILGKEETGSFVDSVYLNGKLVSTTAGILKFSSEDVELLGSTYTIRSFNADFLTQGIKIGDTLVVDGSSSIADDGAYRILDIDASKITIDFRGRKFSGTLGDDSTLFILKHSAAISELTFEELSSSEGSILFDVFMNDNAEVFYKKRLQIDGELRVGSFYASVSDVSSGYIQNGEDAVVRIASTGYAHLIGTDNLPGENVFIGKKGRYVLKSADGFNSVALQVIGNGAPSKALDVTLTGYNEITKNVFHVSRGVFGTSLGRVLGDSSAAGIPILSDKRVFGTQDEAVISKSFNEKYLELPRSELRSSGIVRGLKVKNLQYIDSGEVDESENIIYCWSVDIDAGIAIVNGIRKEYPGIEDLKIFLTSNFYIAINAFGEIITGEELFDGDGYGDGYTEGQVGNVSPFTGQDVAYLAYLNTDELEDLRLFVDHLDFKHAKEIVVSNSTNFGHFTFLEDAVKYAHRISGMFETRVVPSIFITEGEFTVSSQIVISADMQIRGSGSGTILRKKTGTSFAKGMAPILDRISMKMAMFLIGASQTAGSDRIQYGVTLKDFTYVSSVSLKNVGCVIALTQPLVSSDGLGQSANASFRFQNINFLGPENMSGVAPNAAKVGEYALYVGQQNVATVPTSNITMGRIFFTNCFLKFMGLEYGGIAFTESDESTFKDIIVCNNIAVNMSPNINDSGIEIVQDVVTPTMTRLIEANNAVSV